MSSPAVPAPQLDPALAVQRIADVYRRVGRVHICPILTRESAEQAHRSLATEVPWQLHFNDGERSFDIAEDQFQSLAAEQQAALRTRIHANAAQGFQYLFSNFPLSDAHALGRHMHLYVMRVYEFLNSPAFLGFARRVTGESRIALADAQATLYRPGHFLTRHDDLATDKHRVAAYVLNLTPRWSADWGGILNFLDRDGHVAEGYTPVFNGLNLFRVPQPHSVSYVAPFAAAGRYSITGWLRTA